MVVREEATVVAAREAGVRATVVAAWEAGVRAAVVKAGVKKSSLRPQPDYSALLLD